MTTSTNKNIASYDENGAQGLMGHDPITGVTTQIESTEGSLHVADTSVSASQKISINTTQVVAIGLVSAQSAVVNASTNRVILSTTISCWINIGSNPTAVARTNGGGFFLMEGGQSYPISVTPGVTKISVIQDSSSGHLSIIEIA